MGKSLRFAAILLTTTGLALGAAFVVAKPATCQDCPSTKCKVNADCGTDSKCHCSSTGSCAKQPY